jgi:hypothetical protein
MGLTTSFRRQIRYLLEKTHTPRVVVRASQIPGAGNGLFHVGTCEPCLDEPNYRLVLCLYPGIYTPPLPSLSSAGILSSQEDNNEVMDTYLAKLIPPSHVDFEHNSYILNLAGVGGYLDACKVKSSSDRIVDTSPSFCGHIVNHYRPLESQPNVEIVPFLWRDVLESDDIERILNDLPNTIRCDGSPWYFDTITQTIIYFPEKEEEQLTALHPLLAGAAVLSVDDSMRPGVELLLDYKLRVDLLPKWATDWYQP